MLRGLLLVLAGLAAGFAVAWWQAPSWSPATPPTFEGDSAPAPFARTRDDVAALAAELDAERAARAALEQRVDELAAALEIVAAPRVSDPRAAREDVPEQARVTQSARRAAGPRGEDLQERQRERLLAVGFAPDRAAWIAQRTAELRMSQLQAQYDAARDGRRFDPSTVLAAERTLRAELGDADYERYLTALDRPTSVAVREVLASSPGERAGLRPGDEIVGYDGQRVFDLRELNELTLAGRAGETVVVRVRRDGQLLDLVMPRGPIGLFGGGFRGR